MRQKKRIIVFSIAGLILAALLVFSFFAGEPKLKKVRDVIDFDYLLDTGMYRFLRNDIAGGEFPEGKNHSLEEQAVANVGRDTTGLKVALSGSAIDEKLLSNFEIRVRSIIFRPGQPIEIVGTESAQVVEQNGRLVAQFPTLPIKGQPSATGGSPSVACVQVGSYFDALKTGKGDIVTEVSLLAASREIPVKFNEFAVVRAKRQGDDYEYIRSMPKDCPSNPGANSLFKHGRKKRDGSETELTFWSPDTVSVLDDRYRKELSETGWKVLPREGSDCPESFSAVAASDLKRSLIIQLDSNHGMFTVVQYVIKTLPQKND